MRKHPLKKLSLLLAVGIGYVLGARAGRARYEQIVATASRIKGNPTVQAAASKAQETVAQQAPVVASAVKDKAASAASTVQDKVTDSFGKADDPGWCQTARVSADVRSEAGRGTCAPPGDAPLPPGADEHTSQGTGLSPR